MRSPSSTPSVAHRAAERVDPGALDQEGGVDEHLVDAAARGSAATASGSSRSTTRRSNALARALDRARDELAEPDALVVPVASAGAAHALAQRAIVVALGDDAPQQRLLLAEPLSLSST